MLSSISCLVKTLLCLIGYSSKSDGYSSIKYSLLLQTAQTKQTIKADYTTRTHYAHASSNFAKGVAERPTCTTAFISKSTQ